MKLLRQLLETGQPAAEMSLQRTLELLYKRKNAMEAKHWTVSSGGSFGKVMPHYISKPSAPDFSRTYIDMIDPHQITDRNEWHYINWVHIDANFDKAEKNIMRDFASHPEKYLVIPTDYLADDNFNNRQIVWIANKEVMASVGLDTSDFEEYVENIMAEKHLEQSMDAIDAHIAELEKKLGT